MSHFGWNLWRLMDSSIQKWCYQTPDFTTHRYHMESKTEKKHGKTHQRKNTVSELKFFVSSYAQIIHRTQQRRIWAGYASKSRSVLKSTTRSKWHLDYCFCWVVRSIPSGENKKRPNNAPAGYEIAPLLRQNAVPSWSPHDPWRLGESGGKAA